MPSTSERTETAPCELLEWDSEHFGFPIGRVLGKTLAESGAKAIDDWCVDRGIRCLYLLTDAEDDASAQVAAEYGYRQVDVRLTVRRSLEGVSELAYGESATVRIPEASARELEPLRELARRSHHGSRFYVDGGFPRERCDALYAAWVERGLRSPDHGLLVALVGEDPAGYIAYSTVVVDGEGRGDLMAVDERYRGQGIGWALHVAMLHGDVRRGAVTHRGVLSGRNRPIIRLHEKLGFRTDEVEVWHHKWYG